MTPFLEWECEVDALCIERYGVSIHDIDLHALEDAFESGLTPEEYMDQESEHVGKILA